MPPRVLIIGATGMLGRPVARRLVREGFEVRALARDPDRARGLLPRECELVAGDVLDEASLEAAMTGVDAVYVNLAAPRSAKQPDVERTSAAGIARAARKAGVNHLLKISFMGVPQASETWWQARHKAESEQALADSGIDYTIMQPTWFMESLPLFRMGRRLIVPAVPPIPIYWISGDDYARQVAAALTTEKSRNRTYVIQGPEPLTFREAADRFARAWEPKPLKVATAPMWTLRPLAPFWPDARYLIDLLAVTFKTNTELLASESWDDLGKPAMTVGDYARYMRETGDVPSK